MWNLIIYGLSAVLFALLPLAFTGTGAAEASVWSACSLLLAVFLVAQTIVSGSRIRSYSAQDPALHSPRWAFAFLVLTSFAVMVLLANAFGVIFERAFSAYFIGLLWLLAASALTFTRLLGIAFRDP